MPLTVSTISAGVEKALLSESFSRTLRQAAAFIGAPVAARTIGHAIQGVGDPLAGPYGTMQDLLGAPSKAAAAVTGGLGALGLPYAADISEAIKAGNVDLAANAAAEARTAELLGEWGYQGRVGTTDAQIDALFGKFLKKYKQGFKEQARAFERTGKDVPSAAGVAEAIAGGFHEATGFSVKEAAATQAVLGPYALPVLFARMIYEMTQRRHAANSSGVEARRGRLGFGSPVDDD